MRRGSKTNRWLDFWAAIPLLQALAPVLRPRRRPARILRLGVMCSPALGDTLIFSAPLADLRRHFRTAEIVHICMKENLGAAELIGGVDKRVVISLTRPWESVRRLRALKLDLLIDFTPWQRITALHTLLSGARFTAGFRAAGQFRAAGYGLTVEHRRDRHELENFRALVEPLGIEAVSEPAVSVPDVSEQEWQALWNQATISRGLCTEDLIVLHPWPAGAQFRLREWPTSRWVDFAAALATTRPHALFVVTGSPADQPRVCEFVDALTAAGVPAVGFSAGMCTMVALLRRVSLAVCVNTGILHLAAIVGAPTLGLNGPTADHRWGPRGRCARAVGPADGSGGYLHFGYEYPADAEDVMSRITVAQALAAAAELLPCGPACAPVAGVEAVR